MKNINIKTYFTGIGLFIIGILIFNLMQLIHVQGLVSFFKIIIQTSILILFVNTSSIFFYKSMESKDEYLKYTFSFINMITLIILSLIILDIIIK